MQIKLSIQHGNLQNLYVNEKCVHNREFLELKKNNWKNHQKIEAGGVEAVRGLV